MKPILLILLTSLLTLSALASPRKARDFLFAERHAETEVQPPRPSEQTLVSDPQTQREAGAAAAILEQAREERGLVERPRSETLPEYMERMRVMRERLESGDSREEALAESQQDALNQADRQLRSDPFGGSQSVYGHGAGPSGNIDSPPLDLRRLFAVLFPPAPETDETPLD